MPMMIHTVPRMELPENGVLAFQVAGGHYVIADVDGEVSAYAVVGPTVRDLDRAAVAEGRLRCPRHGWPIEPERCGCAAAERCRYEPLRVEVDAAEVRVALAGP